MKISTTLPILLCLFFINTLTAQRIIEDNIGFYHGRSSFFKFKRTIIETDKNIIIAKDNSIMSYDKKGELDESFGSMGVLQIDASSSIEIRGIFLNDDNLVIIATKNGRTLLHQFIYDKQGQELKSSYTIESSFRYEFYDIMLQRDGKILLVGNNTDEDWNRFYFARRLTLQGKIDSTFQMEFPIKENHITDNHTVTAVTQREDGKLLVGSSENSEISLKLYNLDGTIDPSFGENGKAIINANSSNSAAIQNIHSINNKIIVTGTVKGNINTPSDNGQFFYISKFLANGQPDATFGDNGIAIHIRDENSVRLEQLQTSMIEEDGKILLIGNRTKDQDLNLTQGLLVRYNEDGSLDESFVSGGKFDLKILNNTDIVHVSPTKDGYNLLFTGIEDENLSFNSIEFSRLFMMNLALQFSTSISEENNFAIQEFYPNPVLTEAIIRYELKEKGNVQIKLFDMNGKFINVVLAENSMVGSYTRKIDLSNLPKGSYFLNLIINDRKDFIKFVK